VLLLMFSLAGVPPLLGFFGKYAVLFAAVDAGLMLVAILGVIASVIGAFYYLRIVYFMYFGEPREGIDGKMGALSYVGLVAAAAIMVFGVFNLFGVDSLAEAAAATLVR